MADSDWALLRACAVEVVDLARVWWPAASPTARARVGGPLAKLAKNLAFLGEQEAGTARPGAPMVRDGLLRNTREAIVVIRVNCPPDTAGMPLWTACARLSFAVARLEDLGQA
jgi:hypothetical protein